jgi:tetratricopeptide (TPR) repeat protein
MARPAAACAFNLVAGIGLWMLSPAFATAAAERAIWTWEQASYAMVRERAVGEDALAFLRAQHIRTLYLYADAYNGENLLEAQPGLYRQFIARLHRRGMRAYALLGSAYLHTEAYVLPEHRDEALAMFQRVLAYNATAGSDERFDGVNLDIEPHILDQWPEQKSQLLRQFLDLGAALMALKQASGQSLAVGPAIPFWLDGIVLDWHGATRPVSEHVLGIYDYAALMDYRDHALGRDGIVSNAADEMASAERMGKQLVIGVDVTPDEIQKVSFDHLAATDLERELALAARAFRHQRAFAGFAIHHFSAYRQWLLRARVSP